MKLQLTKTKTIDVNLFGGGASSSASSEAVTFRDVTAVDLTATDERGCAAVRMTVSGSGVFTVRSAGFVPPPVAGKSWSLPKAFRAAHAALALPEGRSGARLTACLTGDATGAETHGQHRDACIVSGSGEMKLEAQAAEALVAEVAAYLPEGARPTAASIQSGAVAALATVTLQRDYEVSNGTALAVLVTRDSVRIVGFCGGELVLLRSIEGVCGLDDLKLRAEHVADYSSAVTMVLRQVGLSRDYLERKGRTSLQTVLLIGDVPLRNTWLDQCKTMVGLPLVISDAFGDAQVAGGVTVPDGDFTVAVGAAVAALERAGRKTQLHVNFIRPEEIRSSSPIRWSSCFLWLSVAVLVAVLGWGGLLYANLALAKDERALQVSRRDELKPKWSAYQEKKKLAQDCRGHLDELAAFALSRHTYGLLLAHLAESVPSEMQLVSMVVPLFTVERPYALTDANAQQSVVIPKKEPMTIRLIGRAPQEKTVESFMRSLEKADFGGELVVVEKPAEGEVPSPRIHSFRQTGSMDDGLTVGGGRRTTTLEFDVEFRLKEREFVK